MKHFVRRLFHCQKQPLAEIRRELDQGHTVIAASLAGNGTGLTQLCFYWLREQRLWYTRVTVEKILPVFGPAARKSFYRAAGVDGNTRTAGDEPDRLADEYALAYALAHPGQVHLYVCRYGGWVDCQTVYDMFIREWLKDAENEV